MGRIAAAIAMVGVLSIVFLFQNCGKAGFENSQALDEASTEQTVDPKLASLPFPYQISVNQIAHMSCPMSVPNANVQSPYFSWKVGAFDNPSDQPTAQLSIRSAGLQLRSEFLTEWTQVSGKFTPTTQKDKMTEALRNLPSVANARLQLSFRKTNTPRKDLMTLATGGASPTVNFLAPVSDAEIASQFVETSDGMFNLFPNVSDFYSRFLEAKVLVPSSLGAYDAALRANYDASFLALGFVKEDSNDLISAGTDDRYAYGKGFRVHFGVTNTHQGTSIYPSSDSLAAVEEYDLETGARTAGVAWDCSYRFKIVRPSDRYNTAYRANHFVVTNNTCPTPAQTGDFCESPIDARFGIPPYVFGGQCPSNRKLVQNTTRCPEQYSAVCPHEPYTANLSDPSPSLRDDGIYHPSYPNRPAILQALRRFLPADQWDINVSRKCIVPKVEDNTCYQSGKIVYDEMFFPEASANPNAGLYSGCGVNGQYPCASYLTLCIRR
jgi:hypothetical protein